MYLANDGPCHGVELDARVVKPIDEVRQSARIRTDGIGRACAVLEMVQEIIDHGEGRVVRTDNARMVGIGRDVDSEVGHGLSSYAAVFARAGSPPLARALRALRGAPTSPPARRP